MTAAKKRRRRRKENRFLTADGKPMGRMQAIVGGKSVGVPGDLRMMELLHKAHGKLPWAKDFEPAIKLAEEGFAVSPRLHELLASDRRFQKQSSRSAQILLSGRRPAVAGGHHPQEPGVRQNPARRRGQRRGRVLQRPYRRRHRAHGHHAAANNPSDMTVDDLKTYRAVERPPVCGLYRTHKICGMGPPSSGAIGVLQTLGMLERFDLRAMGQGSPAAEHLLIEAGRLALADRAVYIADPDRINVPTAALIAPSYLKERSALIDLDHRMADGRAEGKVPVKGADLVPAPSPELPSTSHFSIVDRDGNAVAMTTSVENQFGSRLMVDGFILNNQLTDFSYEDVAEMHTVANRVEGGKRPRSSMSPTIVFDANGKLEMVLGSPLGAAIVGLVVKTLVAMIDWNMSPADAAAVPGALFFGNAVILEPGLAKAEAALKAIGQPVRMGEYSSGIHIIRIAKDGTLIGGADPRREGIVVGQ